MATELLLDRRQLAAKVESTPGTAETLTAAEANVEVYTPRYAGEPEMHERRPAAEHEGRLSSIVGKTPGTITVRVPLKGSGNVANAPALDALLKGCGMQREATGTIAIGAVTSGPFQAGEEIVGGNSSAIGRVVQDVATGASVVPLVVVSGTFQSGETLTGQTSGATATSSGTVTADQGFAYRPVTTSKPSLTIAVYADGRKKQIHGARGTFTLGSETPGAPGYFDFTFSGIDDGVSDVAMLSGITRETTKPNAFKNAAAVLAGYDSAIFTTFSFDRGLNVSDAGGDANQASGLNCFVATNPTPQITVDPRAVLEATSSFESKLKNGTVSRVVAEWPGSAGNDCVFAAISTQIVTRGEGDRDGIESEELTLDVVRASLNTRGDDDFLIAFL